MRGPTDPILKKTVLITGATSGMGLACARELARAGARLLIHGRDPATLDRAAAEMGVPGTAVQRFTADLASLEQTAALAREVARAVPLDVLINNAGVGFGRDSSKRELSHDGHELRFAVNYLAPFLLTEELLARGLPRLAVINVASAGQDTVDFNDLMSERAYSGVRAYGRSKLSLIMMTFDLASMHPGLQVQALHPGTYLDSRMVREAGIRPVERGADSVMGVLTSALAGGASGRYFDQTRPARVMAQAYDVAARRRLREISLSLVAPWRS